MIKRLFDTLTRQDGLNCCRSITEVTVVLYRFDKLLLHGFSSKEESRLVLHIFFETNRRLHLTAILAYQLFEEFYLSLKPAARHYSFHFWLGGENLITLENLIMVFCTYDLLRTEDTLFQNVLDCQRFLNLRLSQNDRSLLQRCQILRHR